MSYIHGLPLEQSHEHTLRQIYASTHMVSLSSTVGWTCLSMFDEGAIEIEVGETGYFTWQHGSMNGITWGMQC